MPANFLGQAGAVEVLPLPQPCLPRAQELGALGSMAPQDAQRVPQHPRRVAAHVRLVLPVERDDATVVPGHVAGCQPEIQVVIRGGIEASPEPPGLRDAFATEHRDGRGPQRVRQQQRAVHVVVDGRPVRRRERLAVGAHHQAAAEHERGVRNPVERRDTGIQRTGCQSIVGVKEHDEPAARFRQSAVTRAGEPSVRLGEDAHAGQRERNVGCAVHRSIVDDDDFGIDATARARDGLGQEMRLVEARNHDGDERRHGMRSRRNPEKKRRRSSASNAPSQSSVTRQRRSRHASRAADRNR